MIDQNNGASIQQIAYPGNMNTFKQFAIRTFLNTAWDDWRYFSDDATLLGQIPLIASTHRFEDPSTSNEILEYIKTMLQTNGSNIRMFLFGTSKVSDNNNISYSNGIALFNHDTVYVLIFSYLNYDIFVTTTSRSSSSWKDIKHLTPE